MISEVPLPNITEVHGRVLGLLPIICFTKHQKAVEGKKKEIAESFGMRQ